MLLLIYFRLLYVYIYIGRERKETERERESDGEEGREGAKEGGEIIVINN